MAIGGFALKTLKKLNGARFGFPSLSIVLTKAIGRGAIALSNRPCTFGVSSSEGVKDFMQNNLDCEGKG